MNFVLIMATYQIPTPEPMKVSGNVAHNWTLFREAYQDFAKATELDSKAAGVQVSALKSIMGTECKRVLNQLMTSEEQVTATAVLDRLETHFQPARNVLYERHEFFKADQLPTETLDQYLVRLRHLASTCAFTASYQYQPPGVEGNAPPPPVTLQVSYEDQMIRDRLVFGCTDKDARRRVFRETDISLEKAVEMIRVSEVSKAQLQKMGMEKEVHVAKKKQREVKPDKQNAKPPATEKPQQKPQRKCKFCNTHHKFSKSLCPAWGKTCKVCGRNNHLAGSLACKGDKKKKVHQVVAEDDTDEDGFIYSMNSIHANSSSQFLVSELSCE